MGKPYQPVRKRARRKRYLSRVRARIRARIQDANAKK